MFLNLNVKLQAVPQEENIKGSFIAEEWIEKKDIKKYDEFLKFSLAAGEEA